MKMLLKRRVSQVKGSMDAAIGAVSAPVRDERKPEEKLAFGLAKLQRSREFEAQNAARCNQRVSRAVSTLLGESEVQQMDCSGIAAYFTPGAESGFLSPFEPDTGIQMFKGEYPELERLEHFVANMPFIKADGKPGYAANPVEFARQLEALPDFSVLVARVIRRAASEQDGDKRLALCALLSDLKTRFAWINQLERFSGNLRYHKDHEHEPDFDAEKVGPANPIVSEKVGVPLILCKLAFHDPVLWQNYMEYSGNNYRLEPGVKPPYDRDKIAVPVLGAGGMAERGFIGNHTAQEKLTGAIVKGWHRIKQGFEHDRNGEIADGVRQVADCVKRMATIMGQMVIKEHKGGDTESVGQEMAKGELKTGGKHGGWMEQGQYPWLRVALQGVKGHTRDTEDYDESSAKNSALFPPKGVCWGSEVMGLFGFQAGEFGLSEDGWSIPRGETGAMTVYVRFADWIVGLDRDPSVYGANDLTTANDEFDFSRETGQRTFLLDVMEQCLTGKEGDAEPAREDMLSQNLMGRAKESPLVALSLVHMAVAKSMHNLNHLCAAMDTIYMNQAAKSFYMAANSGGATSEYLHQSLQTFTDYNLQLAQELNDNHNSEFTAEQRSEMAGLIAKLERYNVKATYYMAQLKEKQMAKAQARVQMATA